jgi:DNA-binding transcriptional regulator/RsmH inhibitor MraZ
MLLTGTYPRTLDEKNRLALPKRFREQLGEPETLYVTPGPDQCLWLYTQRSLEQLAEKLDQAAIPDGQWAAFRRGGRGRFSEVRAIADTDEGLVVSGPARAGAGQPLHPGCNSLNQPRLAGGPFDLSPPETPAIL